MPLNILLSKINWHRIVEKLFCFCVFLLAGIVVAHAEDTQVKIEIGAITYSDVGFAVDVITTFDDMSLYNDQVYLSYHIVDKSGEEILFENQRIPVDLQSPYMTMFVDFVNSEELANRDDLIVCFDLVDQENIYWFSRKTDIEFEAASVAFDREMLQSAPQQAPNNEEMSPTESRTSVVSTVFSTVLNVTMWAVLAVLACLSIKRRSDRSGVKVGMSEQSKGIAFITYLRGLACIFVLLAHYIGIFELGSAHVYLTYMLPRSSQSTVFLNNIIGGFLSEMLNFGQLGVSIFFLITGFLTAQSLDRNSRFSFFARKIVRIYPVYIVGTIFLYITTFAYTKWAGTGMPWPVKYFVIQASLLRDWFWIPSVDQIGWTLEVQLKMYIVYFLLYKLKILQNSKLLMLTAGISMLFILGVWPYADKLADINRNVYIVLYVLVFAAVFVMFGLLGVIFYQYFCNRWTVQEFCLAGGACLFCFWTSAESFGQEAIVRSYFAGVVLFAVAFLARAKIHCGKILSFISKISFSVYIVHGLNGYYLLSILDYYGVNPYVALFVTICVVLLIALCLYRLVEKPCAQILKRIDSNGDRVQSCRDSGKK